MISFTIYFYSFGIREGEDEMRERNKTIICILFIYKMHCNGCIKLIYT